MNKPPLNATESNLYDEIESIARDLENAPNKPVMREDFFKNVFLQMFAGKPESETKVNGSMWITAAQGPFNEVTVVDMNGNFLFDVPPYFSAKAMQPLDGTRADAKMQTVTDMIANAKQYASRGVAVVEGFIATELDKRSFMFNKDADNSEEVARWNAIFARYGIKPIDQTLTVNKHASTDDVARDSSDFDPLP